MSPVGQAVTADWFWLGQEAPALVLVCKVVRQALLWPAATDVDDGGVIGIDLQGKKTVRRLTHIRKISSEGS